MSHEIETMAFAVEPCWHGLGTRVDRCVTPDEMLVAAGLNWTIDPHPVFTKVGEKYLEVKNKQAFVRSHDQKVLTMASDGWVPCQNKDMLSFFKDYCDAGGATLETAGSLRGGSIVWALANLKDGFTVGGKNSNDRVNGYLLFTSPHKVGTSIKIRTTTVRVVCANTLALAESNGSVEYKQNHMRNFDFSKAHEAVERAHQALAQAGKRANTLKKLKIGVLDSLKLLAPIFDAPAEMDDEELMIYATNGKSDLSGVFTSMKTAPGAEEGTGWGVLNGVTHYSDHVAGRHAGARVWRSWLGDLGNMKLETEAKLLELV